jgi:hypothetical protein
MNKTRILNIFLGASLVVAAILIGLGFNAAPEAKGSSAPSIGFGDLRRFEGQSTALGFSVAEIGEANSRLGDLHPYVGQLTPAVVEADSRFRAEQMSLLRERQAETARWEKLAASVPVDWLAYNPVTAWGAELARWEKLAAYAPVDWSAYNPVTAWGAELARWNALAATYK